MKSDTEQISNLLKSVNTFRVRDLYGDLSEITDELIATKFLREISKRGVDLPTGTVFKVHGLDKVLRRTELLFIAGSIHCGNVVLCIDRAALELETILYGRAPRLVGVVKSVSFSATNDNKTQQVLGELMRTYQDMVMKIQLGIIPSRFTKQTLINFIHEYMLTGHLVSEFIPELYD